MTKPIIFSPGDSDKWWRGVVDSLAPGPIGLGAYLFGLAVGSDWTRTETAIGVLAGLICTQFGYWMNQRSIDHARSMAVHHLYLNPVREGGKK